MGIFDGLLGGMFGGLTSLFGGINTNQAQKDIAQMTNQFNAEQAQKQMDFQERMRATQYQTATDDMQKAGLNPMLAYGQGGAGTPSGAMAIGQQAQLSNPTTGLAHSAAQMANIKADLELKDQQATNIVADTTQKEANAKLSDTQSKLNILNMGKVDQETKNLIKQSLLIEAQTDLASASKAAAYAQATKTYWEGETVRRGDIPQAESKGNYYKGAPYNPYYVNDAAKGISSATGVVNMFKR